MIIAVADDLFDQYVAADPVVGPPGVEVEVVRESSLADPNNESDLWLGKYQPSTPGCEQIANFAQWGCAVVLEQDRDSGAVYRDGVLVWPSAPVVVANMAGGTELLPLTDVALHFCEGSQVRITTVPDVMLVIRQFRLRPLGPNESLLPDWIERARIALANASPKPRRN